MKHDATVTALGNIVVQLQFELLELVGCDNVSSVVRVNAGEGTILDLPAGAHVIHFEVMPSVKIFSIEEQIPAGALLRSSEHVGFFICSGNLLAQSNEDASKPQQKRDFHGLIFDLFGTCKKSFSEFS